MAEQETSATIARRVVNNNKKIAYLENNPNMFGKYLGIIEPNKFQTTEGIVDLGTYSCRFYQKENDNVMVFNQSIHYRDYMRRVIATNDGEKAEFYYRRNAIRFMSVEYSNAKKILDGLDERRDGDKGLEMIGQEDPSIYEKFLSLRSLILPIEKKIE